MKPVMNVNDPTINAGEDFQNTYTIMSQLLNVLSEAFPGPKSAYVAALTDNLVQGTGKKRFLVFKNNKYRTIGTDEIAFIHMRYKTATIVTYKEQQYCLSRSLDEIQTLLCCQSFYRVNRQYIVSLKAIKEVEHFYGRKLLISLVVPCPHPLLVAKDKTSCFLSWMDRG